MTPLATIAAEIEACRACPRLVAWREEVARVKRRAYRDETYWGRPIPGFGDPQARILIVGLAPGAHGANRTGRMFTGDDSGDFLYAALHRSGLASQPTSRSRDDGLRLEGCFISAAARCAPPDNRPAKDELARCAGYLDREIQALRRLRVVLALGAIALDAYLGHLARAGATVPKPRPRFAHGLTIDCESSSGPSTAAGLRPASAQGERGRGPHALVASYHVSRQNTRTGRLTPAMFDQILETVRGLAR